MVSIEFRTCIRQGSHSHLKRPRRIDLTLSCLVAEIITAVAILIRILTLSLLSSDSSELEPPDSDRSSGLLSTLVPQVLEPASDTTSVDQPFRVSTQNNNNNNMRLETTGFSCPQDDAESILVRACALPPIHAPRPRSGTQLAMHPWPANDTIRRPCTKDAEDGVIWMLSR